MGQVHEQGARPGRRVVTGDIAHRLVHQNSSHYFSHGVGCIIFGVFSAAVFVVILDQVFKNGGEKIEFLVENFLETEIDQLVYDGAAKVISPGTIGYVVGKSVKKGDLCTCAGLDGKDVIVENGDVAQSVVKELGELPLVLSVMQLG